MDGAVLAQLMRQGAERGVDLVTLRAIVEEAGELGAARALARVALSDERAREDVAELRELLAAWRPGGMRSGRCGRLWWGGSLGWRWR